MTKLALILATISILVIGCSEQADTSLQDTSTAADPVAAAKQALLNKGKSRAMSCAACHGQKGISNVALYPSLAGRDATELKQLLLAYRSGEKTNPLMSPQAKSLSDEDIDLLAKYYAALAAQ
ncbi:c-type cytochrome [Rheinheimera sp. MMS21-TC3]|uniref:c-type cytochrome n=1 Tax=Rheinheimera sp. MMS21-TC3 TaxID=3072790 RepID=UPI0028C3A459|nr:c-type cytochrome [Rheinheimera sp. MMS21-TC3]WNO60621.1 c-type cytochrome [Rheinheimera sp. MMS21-TC3]